MKNNNNNQNDPFLLENSDSNYELPIEDLIKVIFDGYKEEMPYEILIQMDFEKFERKFKSVSKFYRVLSNSNQTISVRSPIKNNTNRKWWNFHFSGGEYTTYKCGDKITIHFELDCNPAAYTPSVIQVKMRIMKALNYKPFILLGTNNDIIDTELTSLQDCIIESQTIGKRYNNKENLDDANLTT
jgi:hypothetical protein